MTKDNVPQTSPRPFIFVLMPIRKEFDDVYQLGIKAAAEEAGAYAQRADEQIFQESILDRILNQINKADVIVADMTDRNPNVFYEVGYSHALNKIVLLLTQRAEDIPFDLKHRQHIVYGGSIVELRNQLVPRIAWAIEESKKRSREDTQRLNVEVNCGFGFQLIPSIFNNQDFPTIDLSEDNLIMFKIINNSSKSIGVFSHIYLLMDTERIIKLQESYLKFRGSLPVYVHDIGVIMSLFHIKSDITFLPKGAYEFINIGFLRQKQKNFGFVATANEQKIPTGKTFFILRLHSEDAVHEYGFHAVVKNND